MIENEIIVLNTDGSAHGPDVYENPWTIALRLRISTPLTAAYESRIKRQRATNQRHGL